MTKEELAKYAVDHDLAHVLDEEVHDAKSEEAANINNAGPESQIDFLLESGYSLDRIEQILRD
jgi:hypothetical protein